MPKGDKYINLTNYLLQSKCDSIEMTFKQIEAIVGTLPNSAYKHQALWSNGSQGSFSFGWLNAGYSAQVKLNQQTVIFTKSDVMRFIQQPLAETPITTLMPAAILDIDFAVEKTQKYYATTQDATHTRYRSWEHCYLAFSSCQQSPDRSQIELLCLHLAWYLASWGMLRNSFLMNYDYLVHKPLLEKLLCPHFMQLFSSNMNNSSVELTLEAASVIEKSYPVVSITDTLVTKILLGIFGVVPAYDRFFKNAARKYAVCSGTFNEKSLNQLWEYYNTHTEEFSILQNSFLSKELHYPPMKIMDMCLWQIGYDLDDSTELVI